MQSKLAAAVLFSCAASSLALAAPRTYALPEPTATLRPGPGVESAQVCAACHSVDYINFQPAQKGAAFWDAEVQKMIKIYRAPIDEADAKAITAYLAATY